MEYRAGSLVHVRNRNWIVMPSNDSDLLLLKPLGGSEDEIAGIYLPLRFPEDQIRSTEFPSPSKEDIGDFSSSRLLYDATRLSFRNGAGPFRSLAKLSFRPRPYQIVPMVMALRQKPPIRLLIADDVGIGKTIEALLILKELLERRIIRRFAIIALPHLCEQWQGELKEKIGIDAVIIRSNTQARLDREIPGDTSVFDYYPYQVISIDYIKSEQRRRVFIEECPDFVIVDEAHTCSKPTRTSTTQQQRYALISDISRKHDQNLVLLTATPHSGKPEEFSSLLGLVDEKYLSLDLSSATQKDRDDLAKYYIQRRRKDIERWMGEDTNFPERDQGEFPYELSMEYYTFYDRILEFAFEITRSEDSHLGRQRLRYWSALALLRGVMSSPDAGVGMLKNRNKSSEDSDKLEESEIEETNPNMDDDYGAQDYSQSSLIGKTYWKSNEQRTLSELEKELEKLKGLKHDYKVTKTIEIMTQWIKEEYNPIIFCRFIATANYIGEILKEELVKIYPNINVQVITSEEPDDVRKQRIDDMKSSKSHKILVATDCLSEGINLQDQFTAVLHYDLPWNPNRLEQREGRVDRFGQNAEKVKTYLLYGKNNPIDGVVLKVLLKKVREIRKSIGISIPFPEDSKSLIDSVLQAVLLKARKKPDTKQLSLDFGDVEEVEQKELIATKAIEKAAEREKESRSIFAQRAIKPDEIEQDLKQSDEAIGTPQTVESFVVDSLNNLLGAQITKDKKGYDLFTVNLPEVLKSLLPDKSQIKVSFISPTPEGYLYLGRNHTFIEHLCQYLMANSINHNTRYGPARASVIKCDNVEIKTTILLFRVRNVIEEKQLGKQLVAEEMLIWGFSGSVKDKNILSMEELKNLIENASATSDLSKEAKIDCLDNELNSIKALSDEFNSVAIKRAEILLDAHERFQKLLGDKKYKIVKPVLPMDLLGIYILLPDKKKH